jgi:hypothetical protein
MQRRGRRPALNDPERIRRHDEKLWQREVHTAQVYGRRLMMCPCVQCQGEVRRSTRSVQVHLNVYGRHPEQRICYEGDEMDSSDEEWATDWARRNRRIVAEHERVMEAQMDVGEGLNIPEMVQDIFVGVDEMRCRFDIEHDQEETFASADSESSFHIEDLVIDEDQIRNACTTPLYPGASISILGFLVMFSNICTCHSVPKIAATELLSFFKRTVLPRGNNSPKSMYEAHKLLSSMGLDYEKIGACRQGCVLFRKEFADLQECLECHEPRYISRGNL